MDNIQTTGHSAAGLDWYSVSMSLVFMIAGIINELSKSNITFILTCCVGGSTLLYNFIRISKELNLPNFFNGLFKRKQK